MKMKLQILITLISFVTYSTQFNATCLDNYPEDVDCVKAIKSLFGDEEFTYYNKNGKVKECPDPQGAGYPTACDCYNEKYVTFTCNLLSLITDCPLDDYPGKEEHPAVETCTTEVERKKLLGFQSAYETEIKAEINCQIDTDPYCL
ncbi:unnamed protein product [Cunninghamella echinulata]